MTSKCASLAMPTMLESLTASLAASSRLSTGRIFIPDDPIITLASSTLVPWKITKISLKFRLSFLSWFLGEKRGGKSEEKKTKNNYFSDFLFLIKRILNCGEGLVSLINCKWDSGILGQGHNFRQLDTDPCSFFQIAYG